MINWLFSIKFLCIITHSHSAYYFSTSAKHLPSAPRYRFYEYNNHHYLFLSLHIIFSSTCAHVPLSACVLQRCLCGFFCTPHPHRPALLPLQISLRTLKQIKNKLKKLINYKLITIRIIKQTPNNLLLTRAVPQLQPLFSILHVFYHS